MSGFYSYLASTLPSLSFGQRPPISMERFFYLCAGMLDEDELELLRRVSAGRGYEFAGARSPALRAWYDFELALRNDLARIRAARKKSDPARFIRGQGQQDPLITYIAYQASKNPSLIEAERLQDLERWKLLDQAAFGHFFDFEALLVYCAKLGILERWGKIEEAKKEELVESCVNAAAGS
jgi:hypothetical protein